MNKKIGYTFVVLVLGLFLISACQQEAVGRKVMNRNIIDESDINLRVRLNISTNPAGVGEVGFSGLDSGMNILREFSMNNSGYTTVSIRARSTHDNYTFHKWSGDIRNIRGFNITKSKNDVPMNMDRNIIANFRRR